MTTNAGGSGDVGVPHVVLVGMMGSGKTTVGRLLARQLHRPAFDSDAAIETRTGRTVREIFAADGEAAFRALETDALRQALATPEPLVIMAAGGVVLAEANRTALRDSGADVVWLDAPDDLLVARAATGDHRPALDDDPVRMFAEMRRTRHALYDEVANCRVDVGTRRPAEIAEEIAQLVGPDRHAPHAAPDRRYVQVELGERSYGVFVGSGAVDALADLVPATARRAAVVTQACIPLDVSDALRYAGLDVERFEIGDGETAKSLATIAELASGFARFGLTRNDAVIAVGGGLVTDVGGFAAASWHRGVAVIHVPTTLLGMVDAAIGGKTGVNLPEGKNLVGAFWQPSGVICDIDALASLPEREWRSGNGEMAKYHFLTGDDLEAMDLTDRVARCVQIKADVVSSDEREGGRRALLNYGHTLAHALEIATGHDLTHGEAVGLGLVFAAELAASMGRIDADRVAEHRHIVGGLYGLATEPPAGLDVDELVTLMGRDKKALDGGLTFVLDGPSGIEVVNDVPADVVVATLRRHVPSGS